MVRYFFFVLLCMVLPSNTVTSQQLVKASAQTLLETVLSKATNSIGAEIYRTKNIERLKAARKMARDRKEVHLVELYTEMIAECKKSFFERHYILTSLIAAGLGWYAGKYWRIRSCALNEDSCVWQW